MSEETVEKKNNIVFIIILVILLVTVVTGVIIGISFSSKKEKKNLSIKDEFLNQEDASSISRGDVENGSSYKIHYISNGPAFSVPTKNKDLGASPANSIVLESNGHYALIDTGLQKDVEENKNHSKLIISYLQDKLKISKLDFILITHDHYDHLGGINEILDKIPTDVVYVKPYYSHDRKDGKGDIKSRTLYANLLKKYFGFAFSCNDSCVDNPDSYRNALKKVDNLYNSKRKNVGASSSSTLYKINANAEGKKIKLGSMIITLYNATNLPYHSDCYGTADNPFDENSNSIVLYITMGNRNAIIAGDLEKIGKKCYNAIYGKYGKCKTNECSIMNYVVNQITGGKVLNVDLLELPHHGYSSCDVSSSIVNPRMIVIPNWSKKINYYYSANGPYSSAKSCKDKYYKSHSNVRYVESNNLVYKFTNSGVSVN